ncbi:hypothetical protein HUJ05_004343 [Dendroctonus ponderosae]|nr:hypothetical protein HUJ05_004343 [Dendroctonus ponderosae]
MTSKILQFHTADLVMTKNCHPGAFGSKWTGPWEIVAQTGRTTYDVLMDGGQWNIHLDDLRPAPRGNPEPPPDDDLNCTSETESDEEYEFPEDMARINDSLASQVPTPSLPDEEPIPGTSHEPIQVESGA